MRLGDLDDLKVHISNLMLIYNGTELNNAILNAIDDAQTVINLIAGEFSSREKLTAKKSAEEIEKHFITECRNAAIEQNLPLYFIYYEETGIFEVYVTETKELFEKRHCSKHLPNYKFKEIAIDYLDCYSDWKVRSYKR